MKKLYTFLLILFSIVNNAQIANFTDPAFKNRLLAANSWNHVADNAAGTSVVIDTNMDGNIQLSEALVIRKLNVYNGGYIHSLDGIAAFSNIESLNCSVNGIDAIDVSMLHNLKILNCNNNAIASINVNGLTQLQELYFNQNQVLSIDVSSLSALKKLECYGNHIVALNLNGLANLTDVVCASNSISSLSTIGLTNLKTLDCSLNQLVNFNPTNMNALESLNCDYNYGILSINLAGMTSLKYLNCNACNLPAIDLTPATNLIQFFARGNAFQTLNLNGLVNLRVLDCNGNQLTSINFGNITGLTYLDCESNLLTDLTVTGQPNLDTIKCGYNQLTTLDLTGLHILTVLYCTHNQLQSLDCGDSPNLIRLFCSINLLEFLNIKNGSDEYNIDFSGNQSLRYICIDESQRQQIQQLFFNLQYSEWFQYADTCEVGTYCSFTPGGTFYTVQGNHKLDIDNNGCDSTDINIPNQRFLITNGITSAIIISNSSGNYSLPVSAGTHTITPVFENPTYFMVSPTSTVVTFPTQSSPYTQDFCITANGSHQDIETWIIPLTRARPGFDSKYKIMFRNKGTVAVSGDINFSFDDDYMDFVSATAAPISQAYSLLTWNYANLSPFETREIEVTFNMNTPLENLPLNLGDIIKFQSTISPLGGDEYTTDNANHLSQVVVASVDPNDKICVEGSIIEPETVGDYVHYVIHFENTGNAEAENIVVKDIIDTNKYDISTLVPLSGSAGFVTNIKNTNQVEFIFENINLPFDDANNDGYVVFKIKTSPTLVVGDTFTNSANIYFDYNFPIVTNTYITTITALGAQDFEFSSVFSLSPVPAKNSLTITTKQEVTISSASIYNTLGQLIQVSTNPNQMIDVSGLKTGNYFIKIVSDKGTASSKFIKE